MKAKTPPTVEEFTKALKAHGLKATRQRRAVHEAMLTLGHASADAVAQAIEAKGRVRMTTASVYNTLAQMTLLGIYSHRLSADSRMYFDVCAFRHLHLYDTEGSTYRDIVDEELMEMVETRIRKKRFKGYKVDGVDIQILCHPTKTKRQI